MKEATRQDPPFLSPVVLNLPPFWLFHRSSKIIFKRHTPRTPFSHCGPTGNGLAGFAQRQNGAIGCCLLQKIPLLSCLAVSLSLLVWHQVIQLYFRSSFELLSPEGVSVRVENLRGRGREGSAVFSPRGNRVNYYCLVKLWSIQLG